MDPFRIDIPQAEVIGPLTGPGAHGGDPRDTAEIAAPVRRLAEQSNRIGRWSEFGRSGHFAAMEEPDLLAGDVREFFRPFR